MRKDLSLVVVVLAFGLLSSLGACSGSSSSSSALVETSGEDQGGATSSSDKESGGETSSSSDTDTALVMADPAGVGPYTVKTISESLSSTHYASAVLYYPEMAAANPVPATTLCAGYLGDKEDIAWLARRIASHGIIVINFDPADSSSTLPKTWANGHKGCLASLRAENERLESPLYHRIDTERLCLAGFSMGGGGALLAAADSGAEVSNVVALHPWLEPVPVRFAISCPVLMFGGTMDTGTTTYMIETILGALPGTADALLIEIMNAVHVDPLNQGNFHDLYSNFIIAWLKYYAAGRTDYLPYLAEDGGFQSNLALYAYRHVQ